MKSVALISYMHYNCCIITSVKLHIQYSIMCVLTNDDLKQLKIKMPYGYVKKVQNEYVKLTDTEISDRAIHSFFSGKSYTAELHEAILNVAETQQMLYARTKQVISNQTVN